LILHYIFLKGPTKEFASHSSFFTNEVEPTLSNIKSTQKGAFYNGLAIAWKFVLICGGSKGIGKAIAKAFVWEGANVVITARQLEALEMAKEELGGSVSIFQADITNADEWEKNASSGCRTIRND
jgi:hypothetical protein